MIIFTLAVSVLGQSEITEVNVFVTLEKYLLKDEAFFCRNLKLFYPQLTFFV